MNPTTNFQVRRATPDDTDALVRLRWDFRAERRPALVTETEFTERCAAWMRPRLDAGSAWRAWLLEVDGDAVGTVWLQVVEKLPNLGTEPEAYGYISSFYVHRDHRNGGGGSALLDTALAHARELKVDAVFLWPTEKSRPLYERKGFHPASEMLIQELWQRSGPR